MGGELDLYKAADIELMANKVARSGLFAGIRTPDAAFTLMLLCQSDGLHPIQAMRRYHIIDGKPSLRADAMLAGFQEQGGKVEWHERTDIAVSATFAHSSGGSVRITWTVEDAKRAGLWGKGNWTKYPRQMLTARVISEGVRTVLPGVVVGIYTPEEVQDFESDPAPPERVEARVIEHEPAQAKAPFRRRVKIAAEYIGITEYQLLNHLWKWAHAKGWLSGHPANPGEVKHSDKLAILEPLDAVESSVFKAEMRQYAREVKRRREVAEVGDGLGIEATPDPEIDPQVDPPGPDEDDVMDALCGDADDLETTEAGARGFGSISVQEPVAGCVGQPGH